MPTTIRLKRVGRKKQPSYRIVVTDSQRAVSGRSIERLGIYNPRTEPSLLELDAARTLHWLRQGAEPSHTVRSLLRRAGVWEKFHAGVVPEELEETEIVLGPAPDQRKTSRRPAAAGASRATAAAGAGGAGHSRRSEAGVAPPDAAGQEEPVPDTVESEPSAPEGAAEEAEVRATEALAADAATDDAETEESPDEPAPGGTDESDAIREGSAVPSAEKTEPAAAPVPEEEASQDEVEESSDEEAEDEK